MAWILGDYCSLADVKLTIAGGEGMEVGDDTLLEDLIHDASREIDLYCGRHFYQVTETRYFHGEDAVYTAERLLLLDDDLLSIDTITVDNGNTTLTASDYKMYPRNSSPKATIKMLASSSEYWTWDTDPEDAISILGDWGKPDLDRDANGTLPPRPIRRACIQLVEWHYWRRNAPFNTVAFAGDGSMEIPVAMPVFVEKNLRRYIRPKFKGV